MSDWGNNNTSQAGGDNWDRPAQVNPAADAWGPTGNGGGNGDGNDAKPVPRPSPFEHRETPVGQWEKTKAYDYEAFNDDATGDWDGNAQVYDWDGKGGDIGPRSESLELQLFGKPNERDPGGEDFNKIAMIEVKQESVTRIKPIKSFATAGLHPAIEENIVLCGYRTPTPIQQYCLPAGKMGYDLIAVAQTGSGKTAAYLIPILNNLVGKAKKLAAPRPQPSLVDDATHPGVIAEPLVVIVCPTRELAIQIFNEARKFCYRTMLRPAVIYGGGPIRLQIEQLKKGCDVLIATPGRMVDLMERGRHLTLRRVKYMVIDEADELLTEDWADRLNMILSGGEQEDGDVRYMLFSATFPPRLKKLAEDYLASDHVHIEVGRAGSSHENVLQDVVWVDSALKKQCLLDYMHSLEPGRCIIFVNNKRTADEIDDFLFHHSMPCTSMHSDRTQREREDAMRSFRLGNSPVMVTTGVSARGIDVRNVRHVINYDLPSMEHGGIEEYIHRIGRTGRIGHVGKAMSFYNERDEAIAPILTKVLLETKQKVPDFLQDYMPVGEDLKNLKFYEDVDENTDNTGNAGNSGGGDLGENNNGGFWGAEDSSKAPTDSNSWGGGGDLQAPADGGVWDGGAPQSNAAW